MLALSIRQPYAELILREIKTAELRSRATRIVGERFYIYAARAKASPPVWSSDLETAQPPAWMIELAKQVAILPAGLSLPTGVIVGSAVIERVEPVDDSAQARPQTNGPHPKPLFAWHLTDVIRLDHPRPPARKPQPTWFRPF